MCAPISADESARLEQLRGKVIVFVTPGYPSKRFIYERAHELGVVSVVVDSPGSWARDLEEQGIIAKFVPCDVSQEVNELVEDLVIIANDLASDPAVGRPVDGLTSFSELMVLAAARAAQVLGLPGPEVKGIETARDKYATRAMMAAAGLDTPANALLRTEADVARAVELVGFPAVLKPTGGAASLGVKKVLSAGELHATFTQMQREMRSTVVSNGALVRRSHTVDEHIDKLKSQPDFPASIPEQPENEHGNDGEGQPAAEGAAAELSVALRGMELGAPGPTSPKPLPHSFSMSDLASAAEAERVPAERAVAFVLEEYLDGTEVDVDVVLHGGEATFCEVVDNGPTAEPYFNETYGVCPSTLDAQQQAELKEMAVAALRACGFSVGVFHVELKYSSRGARLIEINARMGGGQVCETHRRVHGVDLVTETLCACTGVPCTPRKAEKPRCALAYNYVGATRSGTVQSHGELDRLARDTPGAVYVRPLVGVGEKVVGPEDGMPSWLADVMVAIDEYTSPEQALRAVLQLSDAAASTISVS